ncbi:uncharacterized protein KD926_009762 [Aspergillus affinis]|uniref:uncharacterized protein n=1 Tax=Aspergillus affinis TaxID=1070780 RepID=UPI0022FE2011|nr:uncharacterized protein KD926_009762 [Aspergillus affinis]KAI9039320.1 hypothetical protein KD926_009762 [Aspergillus affinis]
MFPDAIVIDGCSVCNRPASPYLCETCKLVTYCSLEHMQEHKHAHQSVCFQIDDRRREAGRYEFRDENGNTIRPEDLDTTDEGWRYRSDNLEYITSHMLLVQEICQLNTRRAVEAQLELMLKTGHLYRNDSKNAIEILCLYFRLGRYVEFYNLMKTHMANSPVSILSTFGPGYTFQDWLKAVDETSDPFEDVQWLISSEYHVDLVLLAMLLKINMLYDLIVAETATHKVGSKVPREILDHILSFSFTTSIISNSPKFLSCLGHTEQIETLRHQIQELYTAISKRKFNIWDSVVKYKKSGWSDGCPGHIDFPSGCLSTFRCGPHYAVDFWHASPWALKYISDLSPDESVCGYETLPGA